MLVKVCWLVMAMSGLFHELIAQNQISSDQKYLFEYLFVQWEGHLLLDSMIYPKEHLLILELCSSQKTNDLKSQVGNLNNLYCFVTYLSRLQRIFIPSSSQSILCFVCFSAITNDGNLLGKYISCSEKMEKCQPGSYYVTRRQHSGPRVITAGSSFTAGGVKKRCEKNSVMYFRSSWVTVNLPGFEH